MDASLQDLSAHGLEHQVASIDFDFRDYSSAGHSGRHKLKDYVQNPSDSRRRQSFSDLYLGFSLGSGNDMSITSAKKPTLESWRGVNIGLA